MQRAAHREEKAKKEEEVKSERNFTSPDTIKRKWQAFLFINMYYLFQYSALF